MDWIGKWTWKWNGFTWKWQCDHWQDQPFWNFPSFMWLSEWGFSSVDIFPWIKHSLATKLTGFHQFYCTFQLMYFTIIIKCTRTKKPVVTIFQFYQWWIHIFRSYISIFSRSQVLQISSCCKPHKNSLCTSWLKQCDMYRWYTELIHDIYRNFHGVLLKGRMDRKTERKT